MNRKTTFWNIDISTVLNTRMFSLLYRGWRTIDLQYILFLLENILHNADRCSLSLPFSLKGVWGSFVSHAWAFDLRLNQGILCMGCFIWIRVIAIFIFEPDSRNISQVVHAHVYRDAVSTSDLRDDLHLGKSWQLSQCQQTAVIFIVEYLALQHLASQREQQLHMKNVIHVLYWAVFFYSGL